MVLVTDRLTVFLALGCRRGEFSGWLLVRPLGIWGCHGLVLLRLVTKPSHVGADVDGLACRLYYPMDCC
jgi:hypothetical protein